MASNIEKLRQGVKVDFPGPEGETLRGYVQRNPAFGKVLVETEDGNQYNPRVAEVTAVPVSSVYGVMTQPPQVEGKVARTQEVGKDPLAEIRAVAESALAQGVGVEAIPDHPPVGEELQGKVGVGAPVSDAEARSKKLDTLIRDIQTKELVAQAQARRELALARKLGRKPPRFDCFSTSEDDTTVIPDLPEGHVGAWIRAKDAEGNPDGRQVQEWARWGYRLHTDKESGDPIVSTHGIAMVATVEADARRRAFYQRGLLSTHGRDALETNFQHAMEEFNRASGRRAVIPVVGGESDKLFGEHFVTSDNMAALTGRGV